MDLLTLKAARLLAACTAVVYDDLASPDVVALASPAAARHYVGKRGGNAASTPQAAIDAQLVALAQDGHSVVRLKGGCPSVFGRLSSELAALSAAGIPYELVPGVSSALAAPLLAGFPLTDVALSRSFAVLSAHSPAAVASLRVPLAVDTLVVLMGGAALEGVTTALLAAGRPGDTPVAVIRAAGTAEQRSWEGTLEGIAAQTRGEVLSPCVIVAGPVAALGRAAAAGL